MFRIAFRKNHIPRSAITLTQEFLQQTAKKESWSVSEALKIYQIIKPHATTIKRMGFDFSAVPSVRSEPAQIHVHVVSREKAVGYDGSDFLVFFPYNPQLNDEIKRIHGAKWDGKKRCHRVPVSSHLPLHRFATKHNFTIGEMAFEMMNNIQENLANSYASEYIELGLDLKMQLYPFQTGGVHYGMKNKRVIIADEMGLGKTVEGIGIAVGTEAVPFLVICPKDLRLNWQDEIHAWTNYKAVILNKNNVKQLPLMIERGMVQAVITNYDGVETFFVTEIKDITVRQGPNAGTVYRRVFTNGLEDLFKGVIADEAHELRNEDTIRYCTVEKMFNDKEVRVLLTGTPVVKGPRDLAALLNLIGRIDQFGGREKFVRQFNKMSKTSFNIQSDMKADADLRNLNIKLRQNCFIRREKVNVLKDLPEKFRKVIRVEIDNRKEYDTAVDNFLVYLRSRNLDPDKIDASMRAEFLVKLGELKKISARGKMAAFQDFVGNIVENGEKIVLFVWFNETAQVLKDRFAAYGAVTICGYIDGQPMTSEQIQANKNRFQNDPSCKMIICTYGKGGVGHTLTSASKWACIETGWTDKDQSQAEDRIHRIGQKMMCECYYFLGADTYDEYFYEVIANRRLVGKVTMGGNYEAPTETASFNALFGKLMDAAKKMPQ